MSEFVPTAAELTLSLEGSAVGSIANNLTTTVEGYALDARQGYALDQKKLDISKVANNLVTTQEGWALDARQGKYLADTKVNFTDIVDNLTSTNDSKVLSAKQGKVLNDAKVNISDVVNNLTTTSATKPLSAYQGKFLDETKLNISSIANDLATESKYKALSAYQGVVLKGQIDRNVKSVKATLTTSGWSGTGPYTQKVTVSGLTADDEPVVDVDLSAATTLDAMDDLNAAWGLVLKAVSAANAVTVYFAEKPDIAIPIKVKGR